MDLVCRDDGQKWTVNQHNRFEIEMVWGLISGAAKGFYERFLQSLWATKEVECFDRNTDVQNEK